MWDVIKEYLPKGEKVGINEIYRLVEDNLELQPDDWEPSSQWNTDPRWKRNVRNILQYRKEKSEIIWIGNGVYMMPATSDIDDINLSIPRHSGMSRDQFERLQIIRQEIGDKGEEYVLQKETDELKSNGRMDLANKVKIISKINVGAGYDILSYDLNGSEKYIEVKTSVNNSKTFEWTENEINVAKDYKDKYWIYLVRDISDKPKIHKIQNPADKIGNELAIRPISYLARSNN